MIEIRPIEPADAGAAAELVTQLGYSRTPDEVADWIAAVFPKHQAAFVAVLDGRVVGWIEASIVHHLQSAPHVLIGGLVVRDGTRGHGVGRGLCERVEQWAWQMGVDEVWVTSRSTRADAHRFYLRDGYTLEKTSLVFKKLRPWEAKIRSSTPG